MPEKTPSLHDKVHFTGPLGVINTGTVLKVEDGVAVVAVDVPLCTFPVGELTVVGNIDKIEPVAVATQEEQTASTPANV